MATTVTASGNLSLILNFLASFSGDTSGQRQAAVSNTKTYGSGGTAIDGFFKGTAVCAAGDWLLAHATDPLQGMGDAAFSDGLTVAGKKLKMLYIRNEDATNSITITRKTGNPLPIFNADADALTIQPGGTFFLDIPNGTAALTTGTNDGLTIAVSGGSPNATVVAVYGS
jgi:hypothetical protein